VAFVYHVRVLVKIVEGRLQGVKYVFVRYLRNISMVLLVMRPVRQVQLRMMMLLNARAVMLVALNVNQKIQKHV
jgi:hypothetical protein